MDLRAMAMGLAFALIWSSAFTSARIIVTHAPPLSASALRFLIAGLIGVAIAKALGQTMKLTRGEWRAVIIFGICQNAIYLGFNFMAMTTIEASLAAIIASSMPLLVALIGWIALGDRVRPLGIIGLVVGFAGVFVIMGARFQGGIDTYGVTLCVIAAFSLAIATLAVRGAAAGGNLMMVVGLQMLVGAAVLSVPAALFETHSVNWTPALIWAFLYTVTLPGLIATFIWFSLVERIGAVKASTFHFLNPFFGVAVAAVLLGERLGAYDVIGVAIIAAGILAVQLSKQKI